MIDVRIVHEGDLNEIAEPDLEAARIGECGAVDFVKRLVRAVYSQVLR
jgi:hypothetical protein